MRISPVGLANFRGNCIVKELNKKTNIDTVSQKALSSIAKYVTDNTPDKFDTTIEFTKKECELKKGEKTLVKTKQSTPDFLMNLGYFAVDVNNYMKKEGFDHSDEFDKYIAFDDLSDSNEAEFNFGDYYDTIH